MDAANQVTAPLDLELARRCVSEDRGAQRELFAAHRERVHRILYRILGANREMEDLAQEAFVAVYRSLARYRGEAKLATWIDRITTRVAYHHLSTRKAAPVPLELVVVRDERADPEQQMLLRDTARRLYAVLDRLEPKYRIAYALHVIDDRPIAEVAELVGASPLAVKNRVWRARATLNKRAAQDPVLAQYLHTHMGRTGAGK